MCNGAQSQQNPAQTNQQSAADPTSNQGSIGEGAGNAMARLISQERARRVMETPQDVRTENRPDPLSPSPPKSALNLGRCG